MFSAPSSMGGRGVGTSPEELLVSAVASCYAGTLFHLLAQDGLPAEQVRVRATGVVTDYPGSAARFSQIVVQPTIRGGVPQRAPRIHRLRAHGSRTLFHRQGPPRRHQL